MPFRSESPGHLPSDVLSTLPPKDDLFIPESAICNGAVSLTVDWEKASIRWITIHLPTLRRNPLSATDPVHDHHFHAAIIYMTPLDWTIVGLYFLIAIGIALYYSRRAGQNTSEFFLSGRRMTWWLAGISIVATTFAADTPMAVTELVAQNGIAGNWIWWNFAFGGMLTVFFFARLWRRCGIQTDVEFVEVRYAGPAAAWLRGIKAIYFGLLLNIIIIGWVSLAMETAINVLWPELTIFGHATVSIGGLTMSAALVIVSLLVVLVSVFALLSGLWGVAVTDVMQFTLAMIGSILMAVFVLRIPEVGGIAGLKSHLPAENISLLPYDWRGIWSCSGFCAVDPRFCCLHRSSVVEQLVSRF